jgi:hypothetical protein
MRSDWLDPDSYKKDLAATKVKSDGGLGTLIAEFFHYDADEIDKRLLVLPKIQKSAEAFKKSKEAVAAGAGALKLAGEVLALVPKVHRKLDEDKKEFQRKGAQRVDVQILVVDWNGKPFYATDAYATFEAPGVPKVSKAGRLSSNGLSLANVELRPSGTVSLMVKTAWGLIEGATDYNFKAGKDLIKFRAVQHSQKFRTRAKSIKEATNKTGIKGSVGLEFEVVKVGGEVSSEDEYKKGFEDEVEWELEAGLPTFKDFKQI